MPSDEAGLAFCVSGSGPTVVLLHGFTQTKESWERVASRLRRRRRVVAVDAPGHGASGHADADLAEAARLLVEAGGPGAYVGYSMGGRICLQAALDFPEAVRALVLIGASPGIADESERAERRRVDLERAADLRRRGLPAFLDDWLAQPLFATLPEQEAGRAERLARNDAEGLARSLERCGTGAMVPLWDRLAELACPTLALAGSLDERYAALARRLQAAAPPGLVEVRLVDGAGHAAHLEAPEAVALLVDAFLAAHHA
jgi:2-succinyl-6-hydroxy-2,4-cyclohexadiene-1-carboxylate synthase